MLVTHAYEIVGIRCFCNFATKSTGFSQGFPGLRFLVAGLNGLIHLPGYQDHVMSCGES